MLADYHSTMIFNTSESVVLFFLVSFFHEPEQPEQNQIFTLILDASLVLLELDLFRSSRSWNENVTLVSEHST